MKIKLGNTKLGNSIATISREIGPTCPGDCPFLGNGCYAERIQRRYATVHAAWRKNNSPTADLDAESARNLHKATAVRLHVAGDFLMHGALDRPYLAKILRLARSSGKPWWVYTHAWRELAHHVQYLRRAGIEVFASVHRFSDGVRAQELGYRVAYMPGVAKKGYNGPRAWHQHTMPLIVCPEQIGTKNSCEDCGYCFRDRKHGVVFLDH